MDDIELAPSRTAQFRLPTKLNVEATMVHSMRAGILDAENMHCLTPSFILTKKVVPGN
jgi:hypothetical protein